MFKKLILLSSLFISVQASAFFVGGTEEEVSAPAWVCNNSSKDVMVAIIARKFVPITDNNTTLSHGDCEAIKAQNVQNILVAEKESTLSFHSIICSNPGCHFLWFNCLSKPECPKGHMSVEDTADGELVVRELVVHSTQ